MCHQNSMLCYFFNRLHVIASKIGKSFDEEIWDKYFRQLPRILGREIENEQKSKNFKKGLWIGPRIIFIYNIVIEKCVQANIQRS